MLRYMKYAYAVWQEGSFTAAAKKLYISQPALSLTIRKLEQEVGFPVFERVGKTVKLTPPGEKYIKAVEQILQIKANLEKELDDMLTLQKGQITVGCSTVISGCVLPRVLKCFMERYPGVRVELKVESSQVLGQLLESGGVDIVIEAGICLFATVYGTDSAVCTGYPCCKSRSGGCPAFPGSHFGQVLFGSEASSGVLLCRGRLHSLKAR